MGFDELSTPRITTLTKQMVSRLLKANKSAYVTIARDASLEATEDIKEVSGIAVKPLKTDEAFIAAILALYNPVTGYLYEAEADRKRARLAEALIAAVIAGLRAEYHKELRKFANLWHTQTLQYAVTVVDETRKETFKKNGIRRVRWETEKDDKVCEKCKARDGKIYDIDKIPPKPHYNCRCWIVPILEKGNNG